MFTSTTKAYLSGGGRLQVSMGKHASVPPLSFFPFRIAVMLVYDRPKIGERALAADKKANREYIPTWTQYEMNERF